MIAMAIVVIITMQLTYHVAAATPATPLTDDAPSAVVSHHRSYSTRCLSVAEK